MFERLKIAFWPFSLPLWPMFFVQDLHAHKAGWELTADVVFFAFCLLQTAHFIAKGKAL